VETLFPLFEGPEKKLEIILFSPQAGIRSNQTGRWDRVVAASRAEIISRTATDQLDAYLLSESSLFVWDDRILMITCGRTTLVQSLPEILSIVSQDKVAFVFYEQKNFLYPEKQPSDFKKDVSAITQYFPGKYYILGPANYDHLNVFYSSHADQNSEQDATLQILMHKLNPKAMSIFCAGLTPRQVEGRSGLADLYPMPMIMDGHTFSPCGYSLNGISRDRYFTVHVTPQPAGSYASFETNIFETDYSNTVRRVISIFKPGRFSVALTTTLDGQCLPCHDTISGGIPAYRMADKSFYQFDCGYGVSFFNYLKEKEL
jgi:S-adenosylmethionine decarboxylase